MSTLFEKLRSGDVDTFKEIFDQYDDKLYGYILAKTHSEYFSKEIVQLTFIKLWHYKKTLNRDIKLSTQIFQISKTIMIDELRKAERLKKNKEDWASEKTALLKSNMEDGYNTIFGKELQENFQNVIENMPPVRQRVYQLSREERLTHKEISKRLSISTKTVEKHMQLALRNIRPFIDSIFGIFF
jgi:RNA polymerase sigma-70 factor (ECF subfamily)